MRLYKIKLCGSPTEFFGAQAVLTDGEEKLVLDKFGNPGWVEGGECEHFYIHESDNVERMEIAYNWRKIVFLAFYTEKGGKI